MSDDQPDNFTDLSRSDMRLIASGIRKGWEIPQDLMSRLPNKINQILEKGSNREQLAAASVLMQMVRDNRSRKSKRKPPQILPVVMTEGNVDDLRRQLIDRANKLGFNAGGDSGAAPPVG